MARTTHARWALLVAGALLTSVAVAPGHAQDEEELDRTPEDCILMNRVSKNVAVNDHQVVFFMRGNRYYRNDLDASCQVLEKGETRLVFHYRTVSAKVTRLCDYDAFSVDRKPSTIGCGLGPFHPITAAEVTQLTGLPAEPPVEKSGGRSSRRDKE